MAHPPKDLDPFEYSVDEVVDALCSPTHGYLRPGGQFDSRKYDCSSIEQIFRENDVDGRAFLCEVDKAFLKDDLEIKSAAKRTGLLEIQKELRKRSKGYEAYKSEHEVAVKETKTELSDDTASLIQLLSQHGLQLAPRTEARNSVPVADATASSIVTPLIHATPQVPSVEKSDDRAQPDSSLAHGPGDIPQSTTNGALAKSDEGTTPASVGQAPDDTVGTTTAKPKKRIAPTLIAPSNVDVHTKRTPRSSGRGGLALKSLFRIDASPEEDTASVEDVDMEDEQLDKSPEEHETSYTIMDSIHPAPGRAATDSIAINTLMKAFGTRGLPAVQGRIRLPIRIKRTVNRTNATIPQPHDNAVTESDATDDADTEPPDEFDYFLAHLEQKYPEQDPGTADEHLLPAYGDSDTESQDSEWEAEIEQEIEQEESEPQESKILSSAKKAELIASAQETMREQWKSTKLPSMEQKAHKIWANARIRRKVTELVEEQEVWTERLTKRLEQQERDYTQLEHTSVSGFTKSCLNMEPTVHQICESEWTIEVLQRSTAPPLPDPKQTRQRAPKVKPDDLDTGDEDLGDTDREDSDTDFIVNDDDEGDGLGGVAHEDVLGLVALNAVQTAPVVERVQSPEAPAVAVSPQHGADADAVIDDNVEPIPSETPRSEDTPMHDATPEERAGTPEGSHAAPLSDEPAPESVDTIVEDTEILRASDSPAGSPTDVLTSILVADPQDGQVPRKEDSTDETANEAIHAQDDEARAPSLVVDAESDKDSHAVDTPLEQTMDVLPDATTREHEDFAQKPLANTVPEDVAKEPNNNENTGSPVNNANTEAKAPTSSEERPTATPVQTSPPSSSQRPIWKEPPPAPRPRTPPSMTNSVIDLDESSLESPTDSEHARDVDAASDIEMDSERLAMNTPLWKHNEILNETVETMNERGDRRQMLVWMIHHAKQENRKAAIKLSNGKSYDETAVQVWAGLDALASYHTKIRGYDEETSIGAMQIASWFVMWVDVRIPLQDKGLKKAHIAKAKADGEKLEAYERFYRAMHDIFIFRHEGPKKAANTSFSLKRQLINRSDSEGEVQHNSGRKKRKYHVPESQVAKAARNTAMERQLEREIQSRLAAERHRNMPSNHMHIEDTGVNHARSDDEDLITLNRHIGTKIFPYQVKGIQFMWSEIVQAQEMQGCLLAQPMGMGKTLQVIALLVTITEAARSSNIRISKQIPERLSKPHFLILCPATLVNNWLEELLRWVPSPHSENIGQIYKVDSIMKLPERLHEINERWAVNGGVLLISYNIFKNLIVNKAKKAKDTGEEQRPLTQDQHDKLRDNLLQLPNIVVCDEAQEIKNTSSITANAVSQLRTMSRIAMTGSPLSNNLLEYFNILNFIAPGYLGDLSEFKDKFMEPIEAGLYKDATNYEQRKAVKMLSVLKNDLAPKVHRDDISVLGDKLPGKTEFVIRMPLTELQEKSYKLYVSSVLENTAADAPFARIWAYVTYLGFLCNHPFCFERRMSALKDATSSKQLANASRNADERANESIDDASVVETLKTSMLEQQLQLLKEGAALSSIVDPSLSHKMEILCDILDLASKAKERTLIFSHSIATLNYIERHILKPRFPGRWSRLDGGTKVDSRQEMTKRFNEGEYDIYIISTRAGGTGINLYGASRVVIMDEHYNPSFEQQAIGRAYRIGQTKHVYVYRLIIGGTFEEAMQNQALFKQGLSSRVVDKKDTIRHARKGLRQWIFPPQELTQEDLAIHIGKDPNILDHILERQKDKPVIRTILLAETFMAEELETLTEEEQKEAQEEQELMRLKRTDVGQYAIKLREVEERRDSVQRQALLNPEAARYGPFNAIPGRDSLWMGPPPSTMPPPLPPPAFPASPSFRLPASTQPLASMSSHTLQPIVPPSNSGNSLGPQLGRGQNQQEQEQSGQTTTAPLAGSTEITPPAPTQAVKVEKQLPEPRTPNPVSSGKIVIELSDDDDDVPVVTPTAHPLKEKPSTALNGKGDEVATKQQAATQPQSKEDWTHLNGQRDTPATGRKSATPSSNGANHGHSSIGIAAPTGKNSVSTPIRSQRKYTPVLGAGVKMSHTSPSKSASQTPQANTPANPMLPSIDYAARKASRESIRVFLRNRYPILLAGDFIAQEPSRKTTRELAKKAEEGAYSTAAAATGYSKLIDGIKSTWSEDKRLARQIRKVESRASLERSASKGGSRAPQTDGAGDTPKSIWSGRSISSERRSGHSDRDNRSMATPSRSNREPMREQASRSSSREQRTVGAPRVGPSLATPASPAGYVPLYDSLRDLLAQEANRTRPSGETTRLSKS